MKKGLVTFVIFGIVEGLSLIRFWSSDLESFFFVWMIIGIVMLCLPYMNKNMVPSSLGKSDAQKYVHATGAMLETQFGGRKEDKNVLWKVSAGRVYLFYIVLNAIVFFVLTSNIFGQ